MSCNIGSSVTLFSSTLVAWTAFFSVAFIMTWKHASNIWRLDESGDKKAKAETYQKVLHQFLLVTKMGSIYDLTTGVLSVVSTVLFVFDTYSTEAAETGKESESVYKFELALANYFMVNWLVMYYAAPNKLIYATGTDSMVDLLTCIPVYFEMCQQEGAETENTDLHGGFLRTAKIWRVTKLIRVFRMLRPVSILARDAFGSNPVTSRIFQKVAWFAILLVMISGVVQVLSGLDTREKNAWQGGWMDDNHDAGDDDATTSNQIMPFHDAFYFVVVTMSTVGYGDIAPISFKSRLLVACLLMAFMVFVPGQISQISQLMNRSSKAARHWMSARWSGHHILVICDVDAVESVESLVKELFHDDRGIVAPLISHVAVLIPSEPDDEWPNLVSRWPRRISVLRGDVFTGGDLERSRATVAVGCFILANGRATSPLEEDKKVLRRALALRNYIDFYNEKNMSNIFIQAVTEEYMFRLRQLGFNPHHVTCYEVLRRYLFISTCICPGISTVLQNVLTTFNDEELALGLTSRKNLNNPEWYHEYIQSLGKEIYKLPAGRFFEGCRTRDLAGYLFDVWGVILLSVGYVGEDTKKNSYRSADRSTCALGLYVKRIGSKHYVLVFADESACISRICKDGRERFDAWLEQERVSAAEPSSSPSASSTSDTTKTAASEVELKDMSNGEESNGAAKDEPAGDRPASPSVITVHNFAVATVGEDGKYEDSQKHIVVVCSALRGVAFMLRVLRRSTVGKRPIIVLCSFTPANAAQDKAALREIYAHREKGLGHIFVWKGVHTSMLERAKLDQASMVILLAGERASHIEALKEGVKLSDILDDEVMSTSIDILALIDPNSTRVVVELMDDMHIYEFEIMKYHSESTVQANRVVGRRGSLTPRLRASVSSTSRLDGATSEIRGSHTEAFQVDDRDHLSAAFSSTASFAGSSYKDDDDIQDDTVAPIAEPRLHASFAAGDLVLGNFSESLLVSVFFNPHLSLFLTSVFAALDSGSNDSESMISSVSVMSFADQGLLTIPEDENITFGSVFHQLLKKDIVAFGARKRCYPSNSISHPPGHWYVTVCPDKDTHLDRQDQVYAIFLAEKSKARLLKTDSLHMDQDLKAMGDKLDKTHEGKGGSIDSAGGGDFFEMEMDSLQESDI